jgi:hypothetical protein
MGLGWCPLNKAVSLRLLHTYSLEGVREVMSRKVGEWLLKSFFDVTLIMKTVCSGIAFPFYFLHSFTSAPSYVYVS